MLLLAMLSLSSCSKTPHCSYNDGSLAFKEASGGRSFGGRHGGPSSSCSTQIARHGGSLLAILFSKSYLNFRVISSLAMGEN